MKCVSVISALLSVAACVVHAAGEEDVCKRLSAGLAEQESVLMGAQDAATASKAVPELRRVLADLSSMHQQVDADALWLYIENHPDVKNELMERLLKLAVQFQRLQKAKFYGNAELRQALAPQLTPPAAPSK
jgi:hypothetical protein